MTKINENESIRSEDRPSGRKRKPIREDLIAYQNSLDAAAPSPEDIIIEREELEETLSN